MHIFVSYTLRDGVLCVDRLADLATSLTAFGSPYVDVLHNRAEDPQSYVLQQLAESELVVACKTPAFFESPWVLIEMSAATARRLPILFITIEPRHTKSRLFEIIITNALVHHNLAGWRARTNRTLQLTGFVSG